MTRRNKENGSTKLILIIILVVALVGLIGFILFQNTRSNTAATSQDTRLAAFIPSVDLFANDWAVQAALDGSSFYTQQTQAYETLLSDDLKSAQLSNTCLSTDIDNPISLVYRETAGALSVVTPYALLAPFVSSFESIADAQLEASCFGTNDLTVESIDDVQASIKETADSALTVLQLL